MSELNTAATARHHAMKLAASLASYKDVKKPKKPDGPVGLFQYKGLGVFREQGWDSNMGAIPDIQVSQSDSRCCPTTVSCIRGVTRAGRGEERNILSDGRIQRNRQPGLLRKLSVQW